MDLLTTDREIRFHTITRHFKKKIIATAITLAIGTATSTVSAGLSNGDALQFVLGTTQTIACVLGTAPPCNSTLLNITDIVGSYFGIDTNANGIEPNEKTPIESFNGIVIGEPQPASGSHTGPVDSTENPDIDNPWTFFGGTGMHQTTIPVTVLSGSGNTQLLDMGNWSWAWNGITVPMEQVGDATVSCDTDCDIFENYTLDATFHLSGAGFTTVPYSLHLEGTVTSGGPIIPTKQVSIQLTGGNSHECSSAGGDVVEAVANIITTDINDIASVNWELDGADAGSGNTIDVLTPLGAHTLSVFVDTLVSGSFQSSESITVSDSTPPELDIRFIDQRTGLEITEVSADGNNFVTVMFDVTDVCDPDPVTSGVAVPVHAIKDGDTIKIEKKKITSTTLGTTAVKVSAEAVDATGNRQQRGATLLIVDD